MRRERQVRRGLQVRQERRVQRGLQVHRAWPDEQEPAAAWSASHAAPGGEQAQRDEPELQVRQEQVQVPEQADTAAASAVAVHPSGTG